jgi:hypothetical protein
MLNLNSQGFWNVFTLVFDMVLYVIGAITVMGGLLILFRQNEMLGLASLVVFVPFCAVSTLRSSIFCARVLSNEYINTHLL